MEKPEVILFDVYDTLLDMSEVEKKVNSLMNSRLGYTVWFELFMEYCFVDNCTVQFNEFDAIAKATLTMCAKKFRVKLSEHNCETVLNLLKHLPVHDGVQDGLSNLNDREYRIAALTNSPEATVRERMSRTGLISYFESVLSAEHVRKYKPSIAVYQWAAKTLRVQPEQILLVTTHGWDVAGAANAGMRTAYINQSDEVLYPLAPVPDLTISNLMELSEML